MSNPLTPFVYPASQPWCSTLPLLVAGRYLALAQVAGMAGRIVFGVFSDRTFGGRRRTPLALAALWERRRSSE